MHRGHIPLVGLTSFTLVTVPTVDLAFRYEEFFWTRSLISLTHTSVKLASFGYYIILLKVFEARMDDSLVLNVNQKKSPKALRQLFTKLSQYMIGVAGAPAKCCL